MRLHFVLLLFLSLALPTSSVIAQDNAVFAQARENGRLFDQMATAIQRVLKAWLAHADQRTLLLPDRLPGKRGLKPGEQTRL
jgi:hypothetical protein